MLKRTLVLIFLFVSFVVPGFVVSGFAADADNACTGDPNKWQQIFNGKDLTGWKHVGPGFMTVEPDGLIHTHGGMGLLYCFAQ